MYYEPDTVWGRTIEGDEEVADAAAAACRSSSGACCASSASRARSRRSRRKHKLEAPKLEHELIWLAERTLVAFQRPASPHRAPRRASTCR